MTLLRNIEVLIEGYPLLYVDLEQDDENALVTIVARSDADKVILQRIFKQIVKERSH